MTVRNRWHGTALALLLACVAAGCAKTPAETAAFGAAGSYGANQPGSPQDFAATVGDRVFFESDQTDLTPKAVETLDNQAKWLERYPRYAFTVEGHADERGTREYNFALGQRRAETVRQYLATRGVASSRMKTISYGKERPVATCDDISCWSQNRRAVIVLNGGPAS